jgi:hypothetical protein
MASNNMSGLVRAAISRLPPNFFRIVFASSVITIDRLFVMETHNAVYYLEELEDWPQMPAAAHDNAEKGRGRGDVQ